VLKHLAAKLFTIERIRAIVMQLGRDEALLESCAAAG
jgi:hypothetical protein